MDCGYRFKRFAKAICIQPLGAVQVARKTTWEQRFFRTISSESMPLRVHRISQESNEEDYLF